MKEYKEPIQKKKTSKIFISLLVVGFLIIGVLGSLAAVQMYKGNYNVDNEGAQEVHDALTEQAEVFESVDVDVDVYIDISPEEKQAYIDKYGVDPFADPDYPLKEQREADGELKNLDDDGEESGLIDKFLGFFGVGISAESDWYKENVETKVTTFPDIAVSDNGDIYICHYHVSTTNLDVVYYNGTWYHEVVEPSAATEAYCSVVMDSTNNAHIIYYQATGSNLEHYYGTFGSWSDEIIVNTAHDLGYIDATIDDTDEIHVSYVDLDDGELWYVNGTTATWDDEIVDSSGDVQNYTGIAVNSTGGVHISYYDSVGQDLEHAYGNAGSWTLETITSTGNVGKYNSIAINSYDYLYVSYFDNNPNNDLRVAFNNGTWYTQTVDATSASIGQYNDIMVDSNDMVHMVYYDLTNQNAKHVNGTFGNWDTEIIDSSGSTGTWTKLYVDQYDTVHVTYFTASTVYLRYGNRSFRTAGSYWDKDPMAFNVEMNTGDTSIINTSTNELYTCYYEDSTDDLYVAYYNNSGWFNEAVDTGGLVGKYCSIGYDSSGTAHISYYDETNTALKHAYGVFGAWNDETIISANDVGKFTSLVVDTTDEIHITHIDETSDDLEYANGTTGSWSTSTIDSGAINYETSISINSTNGLHVSYYDTSGDDLEYAHKSKDSGSWATETADQGDSYTSRIYVIQDEFNTGMDGWSTGGGDWKWRSGYGYIWDGGTAGGTTEKIINMPQSGTYQWSGFCSGSTTTYGLNVRVDSTYIDYCGAYKSSTSGTYSIGSGSHTLRFSSAIGGDHGVYYARAYYDTTAYNNVGRYSSITVDSSDNVHIAYYDSTDSALRYANGTTGSWTKQDVDATGVVGLYTGIDIDINDTIQISYYDDTNNNLKYTNGTFGGWTLETVDNTGSVGEWSSLVVDQFNWTHISYYDDTNNVIKHASRGPGAGPAPTPTPFGPGFVNVSFENPAFEQQNINFDINLNYSQSTYPAAAVSFTYNGTTYYPTLISSLGDIHTWRQTLTMADVLVSDTVPMRWNATNITDRFNFTSTYYHTVAAFIIDNCTTNTLNILNVTHWDELTDAAMDAVLEIVFEVESIDGSSSNYNFSFDSPEAHFHEYCLVDNLTTSVITDISMYYYDNAAIYAPRTYYLLNAELIGTDPLVEVFSLNDSHSTVFQFQLLDDSSAAVQQGYLQIQRYYTGENAYKLVEVSRTDDDGETVGHLELYNPYYIYVMLDRNGNLLYSSNPSRAYCATAPCTITVIQETAETFRYPMQVYDGVTYSLTFNDSGTNLVRYQYVDATGLTTNSTLHVYKNEPDGSALTICNYTVASASSTILCDMSNYSTVVGEYVANIYISRSPDLFFDSLLISIQNAVVNFGLEGVFWGAFIILGVTLSALWRPEPVVLTMLIALILLKITGIVAISNFTIISLILIGGIMLWKFRD